jgi:hypothetical protein
MQSNCAAMARSEHLTDVVVRLVGPGKVLHEGNLQQFCLVLGPGPVALFEVGEELLQSQPGRGVWAASPGCYHRARYVPHEQMRQQLSEVVLEMSL